MCVGGRQSSCRAHTWFLHLALLYSSTNEQCTLLSKYSSRLNSSKLHSSRVVLTRSSSKFHWLDWVGLEAAGQHGGESMLDWEHSQLVYRRAGIARTVSLWAASMEAAIGVQTRSWPTSRFTTCSLACCMNLACASRFVNVQNSHNHLPQALAWIHFHFYTHPDMPTVQLRKHVHLNIVHTHRAAYEFM